MSLGVGCLDQGHNMSQIDLRYKGRSKYGSKILANITLRKRGMALTLPRSSVDVLVYSLCFKKNKYIFHAFKIPSCRKFPLVMRSIQNKNMWPDLSFIEIKGCILKRLPLPHKCSRCFLRL